MTSFSECMKQNPGKHPEIKFFVQPKTVYKTFIFIVLGAFLLHTFTSLFLKKKVDAATGANGPFGCYFFSFEVNL